MKVDYAPEWKKDPERQAKLNANLRELYRRCGYELADFAVRPEPLKARLDLKKDPEARR